ncbi:hypothetical protein DPEC_G00052620 [Dallia pectoralis]|uniref:Uncharacterized protein n=1 Tax=Dallia pectoralis TaxID=75939 RepID=A0ACC2HCE0_DALPE|nr:hypothetical protein DPEC_G00052620 [Dallia pectoralis]
MSSSPTELDLTCPVCRDIFRDPLVLRCSHNFCKTCLEKFWKNSQSQDCPLCRRRSPNDPPTNVPLKIRCGNFLQEREEAVQDYKEEIQTSILRPLQDNLKLHNKVKQTCVQTVGFNESQICHTERQIKQEFEMLHKFLRDEEAARIAALRTEEEQKSQMMKIKIGEMNTNISIISDMIRVVEKELEAENASFLKNFKDPKERTQYPLPDPQLVSGSLIDVAKHLGNLQFQLWEKMQGILKYTPVILDPNTAHWSLQLTDDLTSVRRTGVPQKIPENPERCIKYVDVLGSEGFSSGVHSWDVEVGAHPNWCLGVAKESINRRGELGVSPKDGIWCLMFQNGRYRAGGVDDITLKRRPQKIKVQLDYGVGEVSFYDSGDLTHIHTHRDTFTERLFPYFNIGKAPDTNKPAIKICQSVVSLMKSK